MAGLIVTDLDGTLLDRRGRVSPRNRAALAAARAAGWHVAIATGRTWRESHRATDCVAEDALFIGAGGASLHEAGSGRTIATMTVDARDALDLAHADTLRPSMSQIDRRLQNVQQADLSESRVNDDFVLWLKTWGQNLLLVVLVIAALGMAWLWWQERKERERDDGWAELDGATLPAALEEIAARHAGKDSVALFAELEAADTYLLAVITGKRFDREASAVDAAMTPELRAEWLKEADRLYAKVADRVTKAGSTGEYGFLFSALFGRAAVAEDLGDLKSAEAHLRTIED
ncbi:MAG: HAD family hydrolase, partial [Phycisphaerales bacterium]